MLQTRVHGFGSRGFDVGTRLSDFFWTATIAPPLHHEPLRRRLGFYLGELWFQPRRVQTRQDLAFAHTVTLLNKNHRDPLAVVECQLDLP